MGDETNLEYGAGGGMAADLALEAQSVCVLGTSATAAQLAHSAIDTLQLKLVERHRVSEVGVPNALKMSGERSGAARSSC
jgi:hypothetical protein